MPANSILLSLFTGCPTLWHILFMRRFLPSVTVISIHALPSVFLTNFTMAGRVLPSSRSTPSRGFGGVAEPAHGKTSLLYVDEAHHRRPPHVIGKGAYETLGLVQKNVNLRPLETYKLSVNVYAG